MSKSEFKRLCVQNPVGMAEKLHSLEQENAQLREELAAVTKERDEALERIKASQEQESIAWAVPDFVDIMHRRSMTTVVPETCDLHKLPLYISPVIPPTEAELQSQLAAANSRFAVLEAANVQQAEEIERLDTGWKQSNAIALERGLEIAELTKLLAEERKKAVPEAGDL